MSSKSEISPGIASDSPCTGVCQLDTSGEWCVGCGRLKGELFNWPGRSPSEKARIIRDARARLSKTGK